LCRVVFEYAGPTEDSTMPKKLKIIKSKKRPGVLGTRGVFWQDMVLSAALYRR